MCLCPRCKDSGRVSITAMVFEFEEEKRREESRPIGTLIYSRQW